MIRSNLFNVMQSMQMRVKKSLKIKEFWPMLRYLVICLNNTLDYFINHFYGFGRHLAFSTITVLFNIMMMYKHCGKYGYNPHVVNVAHFISFCSAAFSDKF